MPVSNIQVKLAEVRIEIKIDSRSASIPLVRGKILEESLL